MKQLLAALSETSATSGREEAVAAALMSALQGLVDSVSTDVLGNVIATISGTGTSPRKIMLTAPMDQSGLMVIDIEESGYLRIGTIGSVALERSIGARVAFANGTLGMVGVEPDTETKDLHANRLFIDIGVTSKEEAARKVRVGDTCAFVTPFIDFENGRVAGAALSSRAACCAIVDVVRRIGKLQDDLIIVFTAQKEVGRRGVGPAVYGIDPDVALALSGTEAGDVPEGKRTLCVGAGPCIKIMDGSAIIPSHLREWLSAVADEHHVAFQWEIRPQVRSDAGAILTTRAGIAVGALSIPARYMGSSSEVIDLGDVEAATKLLLHALQSDRLSTIIGR